MKKISFLSLILLLLFSKSQNFSPKEKHKLFLTNSPFSKTKKLSKKERKSLGIPPNSYNERFFELTMNPELGYPTLSKKVELQNYLSSISKRNKNWGSLIHRVLHLINLVIYFHILFNLIK